MREKCPQCGFSGDLDEFDLSGACDGCVFCLACNTEFDTLTGEKHILGLCCVDTLHGLGDDSAQSEELLKELKGN